MTPAPQSSFDPDFATAAQWAVMYRERGVQIIPCYYPHESTNWKRPFLARWTELQETIVPEAAFQRWYGQGGQYAARDNMGLITGRASGNIFVVDLDTHKHPEAALWWGSLLSIHNYGDEPETWRQTTGGGGRQILFRARSDWHAPTNKTSIGVDIRGQGGFAVLPSSKHDSGRRYTWDNGCEPWLIDIEEAPEWLLEAVEVLVDAHGGDEGKGPRLATERRAYTGPTLDAFGNMIDGREEYMAKVVWRAVLELRRAGAAVPPPGEQQVACEEAYQAYERAVKSRLGGATTSDTLNREGRGPQEFGRKWRAAMRQWDGKVAREAAVMPEKVAYSHLLAPPNEATDAPKEDDMRPTGGLILSASEFVAGFKPPDYLIDGMVQKSYLYSLTARTGHGKTAVGMYVAQCVARGQPIKGRGVRQGAVLYLAGENPDDIRARFMILADKMGFDAETIPFHFIAGVVDIEAELPRIAREAALISDLSLVVVDTAAAYFKGDDGNSNVQMTGYARLLRQFTFLASKPATIVMAHPIKNAGKENLLPVGGGGFLNEVDGNLTLWANAEKQTTLHWLGKFRGPEFEPIAFKLDTVTSSAVHDSDGQLMPSVVALPISDIEMEVGEQRQSADEDVMLTVVADNPRTSVAKLASLCRFLSDTGDPQKSKAHRVLRRLAEDKLVEMVRGKYRLTAKGRKECGRDDD